MTRLLVVKASPCGDGPNSYHPTRRLVADWKAARPGGEVVERDPTETPLGHDGGLVAGTRAIVSMAPGIETAAA